MQHLFQKLITLDQNFLTIILITLFFTLEQFINTPHKFSRRGRHFINNLPFIILIIALFFFLTTYIVASIQWLNNHHIGLFYFIHIPYALKVIIGVACFDMTTYWLHRVAHKIPLLWRLHRVHHSDTSMDSSTYFRGHPIEAINLAIANVVGAAVFGLDINTLTLYFVILIPVQILEHSNIEFPQWTDKVFGIIFTTPNLHKIHHHQYQYYTDSNFADIFILWDRLFGTYKYVPVKQIPYGLQEFDDSRKQTFWYLIISPFKKIERLKDKPLSEKEPVLMKNNFVEDRQLK